MNITTDSTDDAAVGRRRLVWLTIAVLVFVLVLVFLLSQIRIPVPNERWLGAFDGNHASLSVRVIDEPPFQVLIALPRNMSVPPDWSGSASMTAPDGSQWSTACSAATMKPCNWLHDHPDLDCHILTWNSTPRLSEFMRSELAYKLTLTGTSRFSSPAVVLLSGMKTRH